MYCTSNILCMCDVYENMHKHLITCISKLLTELKYTNYYIVNSVVDSYCSLSNIILTIYNGTK